MRIGIVTEGIGEFRSLASLVRRAVPGISVSGPIRANVSPSADPAVIAGAVARQIPTLGADQAKGIILLIDRDQQRRCPASFARDIEQCLDQKCKKHGIKTVKTVIKNVMFENWLIADPDAFLRYPKRYNRRFVKALRVSGNADALDAPSILSRICIQDYDKVRDALILTTACDPKTVATNSRSFRKFIKELTLLHGVREKASR